MKDNCCVLRTGALNCPPKNLDRNLLLPGPNTLGKHTSAGPQSPCVWFADGPKLATLFGRALITLVCVSQSPELASKQPCPLHVSAPCRIYIIFVDRAVCDADAVVAKAKSRVEGIHEWLEVYRQPRDIGSLLMDEQEVAEFRKAGLRGLMKQRRFPTGFGRGYKISWKSVPKQSKNDPLRDTRFRGSNRFGTDFEPISNRFRTDFGKKGFLTDFEPILNRFRTDFEPISNRFRTDFEPISNPPPLL